MGPMGSADPLEKWMKNLKSENMQKRAVFYAGVENGAMLTTFFIYSDILQNAPFCSQIFKIFFTPGSKGGLTP